jgi:hypothetical protein
MAETKPPFDLQAKQVFRVKAKRDKASLPVWKYHGEIDSTSLK